MTGASRRVIDAITNDAHDVHNDWFQPAAAARLGQPVERCRPKFRYVRAMVDLKIPPLAPITVQVTK
jgi:hypothetical protein